jgi:hypothetical protein
VALAAALAGDRKIWRRRRIFRDLDCRDPIGDAMRRSLA